VAAYGFYDDNPDWLTEDVPARGTDAHFYSQQKAEVERVLAKTLEGNKGTSAYVFRPCIVAGPKAQMLLEEIPYLRLSDRMPPPVLRLLSSMPVLKPVIPDTGVPFQLVHEDDVASAFVAATLAKGPPGAYNLAGSGTLSLSDMADALGWYSIPIPELAVDATTEIVTRLPLPEDLSWIHAIRTRVLMKTDRAKKELGWRPKHSSRATLDQLVAAYRAERRM